MIKQPEFTEEPWSLREVGLDLDRLAQTESLFALSNGHLGWRGGLDEGEPHGLPGTYLNGVYEVRPLPASEAAYGSPGVRADHHQRHERQADQAVRGRRAVRRALRQAAFARAAAGLPGGHADQARGVGVAAGGAIRISSTRLVSFTHRAIAAVCYEVEPVDARLQITVQSELLANEQLPAADGDPRGGFAPDHPLVGEYDNARDNAVVLVHKTRQSGLRVAAAMDHLIDAPVPMRTESQVFEDGGHVTASVPLEPGERLKLIKFVAYGWSSERSLTAVRDQVWAALTGARQAGWDGLIAAQRAYLDDFWSRADVEVHGDVEIQQAVRFGLFHVLQAGARGEERPIPAKGLTGPGYDGHAFWDTEMFVLPALTLTTPDAAASALRWRHKTLPSAQQRAAQLGFGGAAFPWRTITGQECSGYWPAGTAAFHVNADIAAAVVRYIDASADEEFARAEGIELLVQTARLWRSLGHHDGEGRFHIDGVTGPDEYSAIADDNVYTNLMAQHNLLAAAKAAERFPDRARELGIDPEESAGWRDAAEAMFVPYDEALGVHPQAAAFTRHQVWDFAGTPADNYPLMLHYPYLDLYRKQVVKQADLVLAMQLRGQAFTAEQKARNFDYYEALTVRDSSLSACTAGGHGGRGRPAEPGLRLSGRGRPDRPGRSAAQLPRRRAHRVPGRHLDSAHRGLWRLAALRRQRVLRAPPPGRDHQAGLQHPDPRSSAPRRGHAFLGAVPAHRRRPARNRASWPAPDAVGRPAARTANPGGR